MYIKRILSFIAYSIICTSIIYTGCSKNIEYRSVEEKNGKKMELIEILSDKFDVNKFKNISINGRKLSPGILELLKDFDNNKISRPKYITVENFVDIWFAWGILFENLSYDKALELFTDKDKYFRYANR